MDARQQQGGMDPFGGVFEAFGFGGKSGDLCQALEKDRGVICLTCMLAKHAFCRVPRSTFTMPRCAGYGLTRALIYLYTNSGFGHRRRDEELRTPNVVIPLRVTLKQLFQGDILEMSYVRQVRGTPFHVLNERGSPLWTGHADGASRRLEGFCQSAMPRDLLSVPF